MCIIIFEELVSDKSSINPKELEISTHHVVSEWL